MIDGHNEPNVAAPEFVDVETNNGSMQAQLLEAIPCIINGVLEKAKDVDTFAIDLKQGTLLVAGVEANRNLRSPVDMTLQVLDRNGFVLTQNLDFFGLDPCLLFNPPKDDRYLIRVFGFPSAPDSTIGFGGKENWVYRISLSDNVKIMYPIAASDTAGSVSATLIDSAAAQSYTINIPGCYSSKLAKPKDRHTLTFSAKAETHWRIHIEGRVLGSAIDPVITIENEAGKELTRQDDFAGARDPQLDWTCPADANYRLVIRDLHDQGGERYFYRMTISSIQPDLTMTVSSDLFQGVVAKEIEIPVAIQRTLGLALDLKIQIEGLPPEITFAETISHPKDDTAKKVTLRLKATSPFQGPIRIVASDPSLGSERRMATVPDDIPLWLSITAEP